MLAVVRVIWVDVVVGGKVKSQVRGGREESD